MKYVYELEMSVRFKAEKINCINILVEGKDQAVSELKNWADKYRLEWNIPQESDDYWCVLDNLCQARETQSDVLHVAVNYRESIAQPHSNGKVFEGSITTKQILEPGDEVACLPGTVFKFKENPNIMSYNRFVVLKGATSCTLNGFYDVVTKQPASTPSDTSIIPATYDEALHYYHVSNGHGFKDYWAYIEKTLDYDL